MKKSKRYLFPVLSMLALLLLPCLLLQPTPRASAQSYISGSPGVLPVSGSAVVTPTTSVSTNGYTLQATDQFIELPATNVTVTLPAFSATVPNGKTYSFKNLSPSGTNYIAFSGVSGQLIDGLGGYMFTNRYASLVIRGDGSKWYILSSSGIAPTP